MTIATPTDISTVCRRWPPSWYASPVHVIVARGLTIRAAREATATIPIVMAADPDPVRSGFVASLARPGGSITRLSTLAPDLEAKQLELLREALPSLTRVGVLANANSPSTEETARLEAATRPLHLALTESRIDRSEQLAPVFAAMKQAGTGAVLFRYDLWFIDPKQVAALVRQHRLPTMHNLRQFVEAGALVSYGVDFAYLHRRVATYVDKLLKGAQAADLPVEQPTQFELVVNLKTARALGLTIPQSLVQRGPGDRLACSTNAANSSGQPSALPGVRCRRTTARSTRSAPGWTPGPASATLQ